MNYKLFLKIIVVYIVINCILYPLIDNMPLSVVMIRLFLFSIIGIFVGRYVFNKNKVSINSNGNNLNKHFVMKLLILLFLWFLYSIYSMDNDIILLYTTIYSTFNEEIALENLNKYPLYVNFIYDSFISSFALISYIISYFSYVFTIYILKKLKK